MRVAHVVSALFGQDGVTGGAERYAFELSRHMADVVPTTLVAFGARRETRRQGALTIELFPIQWAPLGERHNPLNLGVFRCLREADVVHCHQSAMLLTELITLWARVRGKRVFVTPHGGGGRLTVGAFLPVLALADGCILQSRFAARCLPRACRTRAAIVRGGIHPDRYRLDSAARRERRVLFVGRLLPHKGVDYLVAAMRLLRQPATLTIVSAEADAAYAASVRARASGLPVEFRTGASDAEVAALYQSSAVTVLPSVYRTLAGEDVPLSELMGLTLLESMACGTPVICTEVGGMPEYVTPRHTGLVVPPNSPEALASALDEVLARPAWVEAAPVACAAAMRDLTWPVVARKMVDCYAKGAYQQERARAARVHVPAR